MIGCCGLVVYIRWNRFGVLRFARLVETMDMFHG